MIFFLRAHLSHVILVPVQAALFPFPFCARICVT